MRADLYLVQHGYADSRTLAQKLIADVKAAGIGWTESGSTDIPSDADLSKGPDEWFTFDWWL